VRYTYTKGLVNDSIYVWGTVKGNTITFKIINESKMPIKMNYLIDEYGLVTKDGSIYELEIKTSIIDYPERINPKETKWIDIIKPNIVDLDDIDFLAIDYEFDKFVIFLKRIE
jgi:hypothetical protein